MTEKSEELIRKPSYDYHVVVAGIGAVYSEHINQPLDILGPSQKRILLDSSHERISSTQNLNRLLADARHAPFDLERLSEEERLSYVVLIATPDHFQAIKSFANAGFRNLIVEKPLVNNAQEIVGLKDVIQDNPEIKIYPLDFYVQKTAPLHLLTGSILPDDQRWNWIEDENGAIVDRRFSGSLEKFIGDMEGIDMTIVEGGSFGIQDLDRRTWLEHDKDRGGMLLDLGTHAFAPLFASHIGNADNITVETASRYILGKNRRSFINAHDDQPEIYAEALLSLRMKQKIIPVTIKVGKTFHDGGIWKLIIRGSEGDISMGLRSGQHLTVQPNEGSDFSLFLRKGSNPYALAFQEAHMLFSDMIKSRDVLQPMLDAITVIDKIKQVANKII